MPDTSRISKGRRGENIAAERILPRSILCGRALYCWNAIIDGWAVRWI